MDDADGGNGKHECAGTQESRKRDKLLQFTLLLKNGLVHAMHSTGPHQPSNFFFVETMYNFGWKDEVKHPLCFQHFQVVPSPFCEGACKQQKIAFNGSIYSTNIRIRLCL